MNTRNANKHLLIVFLSFALVLSCFDKVEEFGYVKVLINLNQGSGQNNRTAGILSSDVTKITITISGVDPVNVDVSSGQTVTKTIDGVPVGEQTVKIDLKDSSGTILYIQTQTVNVEAGQISSPSFPADDFDAENVEIELTSPNGGETWELGTTHSITWTTSHSSENVAIELYKNNTSYQVLSAATASTGSYSWTIPTGYDVGSDYKVRVSSVSDGNVYDDSDNAFSLTSISQPTITVTSPNGGETWQLASTHNITWSSADVSGNVKIGLYQNGSAYQIIEGSTDNDGSYSWTIPETYDEGTDYKVRISSVSDATVYDESDGDFTLMTQSVWTNTFGGSNNDEGYSVQQTTDGGYIITGYTRSFGNGEYDVWLIKTDSNGDEEWNQTFGGSDIDYGRSVQQTTDGGYIITGYTRSFGNGVEYDVWLIKTDSEGNEEWNQTFGGSGRDGGSSVQQTTDGGYIIGGVYSYSANWLIKTDSNGNVEWDQTYRPWEWASYRGQSVQQTTDGGYIIAGYLLYDPNYSTKSAFVLKTDSQGNTEWTYIDVVGSHNDPQKGLFSVQQTTDGGYVVVGDYFLKIDSEGNDEWSHDGISGESVQQTEDGGYIITGFVSPDYENQYDVWLIKTYPNGTEAWNQTFGGSESDEGHSVQQTTDGGYIITGETKSFGDGDDTDVWLIKTDSEGNIE